VTPPAPALWLKCGYCNDANLATVSSPRRGLEALPGEDFAVAKRGHGRVQVRPRWNEPDKWTYWLTCLKCRKAHNPIREERIAACWAEFLESGKRRDVRWVGRDL
jgi:hypothetical protein